MEKYNSKKGFYSALLFLVWPFLALISAFRNYRSSWAKNMLWAFVAFYGFCFAIGAENAGSDIVHYIAEYQNLHNQEMTLAVAQKYFIESGEIDILRTTIAIILSRFSDSQAILTMVYGIIFGFFFSRNMWFVLERIKGNIRPITILLFVCFFLVIPIWNMNGFRMWTAAHMFIYGLLPFLYEGKRKGIVISTLAILVHYSFLVPVGVLYVYLLFGNRMMIYFIFFLATFFISEINLEVFNNIIENYTPEILQDRTSGYRGEKSVEFYREGSGSGLRVWYVRWHGRALKWSVMGFLGILFLKDRDFFNKNEKWASLLSFTLFFYATANLFTSLPSGGRFVAVANLCALALITLYVQNRKHEVLMKRFMIVAIPGLLLYVVVSARMGLYSMSATSIFGNPLIALFVTGENISLNDVLKMIL